MKMKTVHMIIRQRKNSQMLYITSIRQKIRRGWSVGDPNPEEEFVKFYNVLPELEQVKRPLPKIVFKCFPLDNYTRSQYMKGALFLICLDHPISLVQTEIFGSKITVEVETHITVSENEEVKVHFSLEYTWVYIRRLKLYFVGMHLICCISRRKIIYPDFRPI